MECSNPLKAPKHVASHSGSWDDSWVLQDLASQLAAAEATMFCSLQWQRVHVFFAFGIPTCSITRVCRFSTETSHMICKLSDLLSFWMILDDFGWFWMILDDFGWWICGESATDHADTGPEALSLAQAREADALQRKLEELQQVIASLLGEMGW